MISFLWKTKRDIKCEQVVRDGLPTTDTMNSSHFYNMESKTLETRHLLSGEDDKLLRLDHQVGAPPK